VSHPRVLLAEFIVRRVAVFRAAFMQDRIVGRRCRSIQAHRQRNNTHRAATAVIALAAIAE
jgi:hypothetical protein